MAMLPKRSQIAAEIEASEGAAETLEGADVTSASIRASNPASSPRTQRGPLRVVPAPVPLRQAVGRVHLLGRTARRGRGDANFLSDVLKACGLSETLVAGTSATYKPASAADALADPGAVPRRQGYKGWGARGTGAPGARIRQAGNPQLRIHRRGLLRNRCRPARLRPRLPVGPGARLPGATLTIDGYSALVGRIEIDFGNNVALRPDAGSPRRPQVGGNHRPAGPTMQFDPENVLVPTRTSWATGAPGPGWPCPAPSVRTRATTVAVTAPKVQYQSCDLTESEGISRYSITALLCGDSGDDEWQIQIT